MTSITTTTRQQGAVGNYKLIIIFGNDGIHDFLGIGIFRMWSLFGLDDTKSLN